MRQIIAIVPCKKIYILSQQNTFAVFNFLKLKNFNELVILVIMRQRKRENDSNRTRKKNKKRKEQRELNREFVILY